jgi:hypothetical protein
VTHMIQADDSVYVCIVSVADDSQVIYVKRYSGKRDKEITIPMCEYTSQY